MRLFLIIWLLPTLAWAESASQMTPLSSELLNQPIVLTKECSKVTITEWRSKTKSNQEQVNLDQICQSAVKNFSGFVKKKKIILNTSKTFIQNISIIPVDTEKRNLNDTLFRFSTRTMELDEDEDVIPILGYHQRATQYIYIYNQIRKSGNVSSRFKTVFSHELFHGMSSFYGWYGLHTGNKDLKEEQLAEEFTEYLGLGK